MAVSLTATAKSATANTYLSLTDANSYLDGTPNDDTWDAASDDQKNRALKSSTDRLEQVEWVSTVTDTDQRLAWPRLGITDRDGREFSDDAIPRPIEEATAELARRIIDGSYTSDDTGLEGFASVGVGSISVTPRSSRKGAKLPEAVRLIVQPYAKGLDELTVPLSRG